MSKRYTWSVTYERWSESDLEAGDTNKRGFIQQDICLRHAIELAGRVHATYEPSDTQTDAYRWITNSDYNKYTHDWFTTGVDECRSLHVPEHITPASRRRLAKLLGFYR